MAVWRKHRFLSSDLQDKQDKVIAGSDFIVYYIGSFCGYENYEKTKKLLEEFLKNIAGKFQIRKSSTFRLTVDLNGAVLYDNERKALGCFELCNIMDVIYCDNIQEYSKYFVFVGREGSDLNVKAHVLICENKEKARRLYQAFIDTFQLGVVTARQKHTNSNISCIEVFRETFPNSCDLTDTGKATLHPLSTSKSSILQKGKRNSVDNSCQLWNSHGEMAGKLNFEKDGETDFDDDFSQLARSRCSSTGVSPLNSFQNGNRFSRIPASGDDVFY